MCSSVWSRMAVAFTSISPTVAMSEPICWLVAMASDLASAATSPRKCSRSIAVITFGVVRRMNPICRRKPVGRCFPIFPSSSPINFRRLATRFRGLTMELRIGHRRYNFVWYRVADAPKLKQMCVDEHGTEYEFGVPPPLVRKDLIAQMRAEAETLLPPQYLDCLRHIYQPFFTKMPSGLCNNFAAGAGGGVVELR